MSIKDSGERTEFETGAVRDMQEGKGRCDLLPLDVLAYINEVVEFPNEPDPRIAEVFRCIHEFTKSGNCNELLCALVAFMDMDEAFDRWTTMYLEVSVHFEEGAAKYGENNWQKGIPVRCYVNSAVRHFIKWIRGDTDERHDRAFCWNILCGIWTCKNKPELNQYVGESHGK